MRMRWCAHVCRFEELPADQPLAAEPPTIVLSKARSTRCFELRSADLIIEKEQNASLEKQDSRRLSSHDRRYGRKDPWMSKHR